MASTLTRTNMGGAIPQDKSYEVLVNVYEDSAILQLADVREMTHAVQDVVTMGTFSVPTTVPIAPVAEAGEKPVSDSSLASYSLVAQKMATFVVFSDELIKESGIDLVALHQDALTQQFAKQIDIYALQGAGVFATENLGAAATAAGGAHVQVLGGTLAASTLYTDRITAAFNAVEADDYIPSGWLIQRAMKGSLRATNDSTGRPLLAENFQGDVPDNIWGEPAYFLGRSVFPTIAANSLRAIVGDFSQFVIGIREELNFSLHSEGIINLGPTAGTNPVNLLQNNLVAIKAEMRLGAKVLANPAFARINSPAT